MDKVEFLKDFAKKIGCELVVKGEVGFCRPCVGIIEPCIEHYVDINPYAFGDTLDDEDDGFIFPEDKDLYPDDDVAPHAYHKHSCLAVLVFDDDYDEAINQLYDWVVRILSKGDVECLIHSEVYNLFNNPFSPPYKVALVYTGKED